MTEQLAIRLDWEKLDEGTAEEKACYAAIDIRYGDVSLTQASDPFVNRIRTAPLLSGYHLAEWIAWNWWRLRRQPRTRSADWPFAHRLTTIGAGYVWPNITVFPDGERIALIAKPSPEVSEIAFRYLCDLAVVLDARNFEVTIDQFIDQVRGQLRAEYVDRTNLDSIWEDVISERRDPGTAKRRKLEALLGRDPDEADPHALEQLLLDARDLGEEPMNEVAADTGHSGDPLTGSRFREIAEAKGFDSTPREAVRLAPGSGLPRTGSVPAWTLGAQAAAILRDQEGLRDRPISNSRLADMSGIPSSAITAKVSGGPIAFALDNGANHDRVVLRSKWEAGRRFEAARLLGDRIVASSGGRLFPATRSNTYRQKMQRAFAAELMSPFHAVDDFMDGDYSSERQQDAAEHFRVSELQIRTLLVNHRRLLADDLETDFDLAVA